MGKEGIRMVIQFFTDQRVEDEDAQAIAQYYLENYRFIYADPDNVVSAICLLTR